LCPEHFIESVERRVKKELREQVDLDRSKHLAVAVSGGKDSCSTLTLVHDILGKRRDVEISCVTVDEGIAGYRPESLHKVKSLCDRLEVPMHLISFHDEIGWEMDEAAKHLGSRTPCAYCGVFRRRCMNRVARDVGADVLATGHNLDDLAQGVLMNFARGDVERLARLGPHVKVQEGLVPRIHPLRQVPEKEVYLYAILKGIDFSESTCPYWQEALRNQYRDIIDRLEDRSPGTKFSILSSYDQLRPKLRELHPQTSLRLCSCGEPSPTGHCMACEMVDDLKKRKG
jgi:uncharacterized protein (TIGR00269 family)